MQDIFYTNARAVLDMLRAAKNHPTALDVYEVVRRIRPRIGLATVYRILHQLTQQGLIKEPNNSVPKRDETEPDVFFWHTLLLSLDKMPAFTYNPCMKTKEYINMRVRKETQRKLKIVAALSGESMLAALDRLVSQEHDRLLGVQKGGQRHAALHQDQA